MKVEFRLTMPNNNSWNGKWSGAGRDYLLYRTLPESERKKYKHGYFYHNFW